METSILISRLSESELRVRSEVVASGTLFDDPTFKGSTDSHIQPPILATGVAKSNFLNEDILLPDGLPMDVSFGSHEVCAGRE